MELCRGRALIVGRTCTTSLKRPSSPCCGRGDPGTRCPAAMRAHGLLANASKGAVERSRTKILRYSRGAPAGIWTAAIATRRPGLFLEFFAQLRPPLAQLVEIAL